jgi:hypothetical protein
MGHTGTGGCGHVSFAIVFVVDGRAAQAMPTPIAAVNIVSDLPEPTTLPFSTEHLNGPDARKRGGLNESTLHCIDQAYASGKRGTKLQFECAGKCAGSRPRCLSERPEPPKLWAQDSLLRLLVVVSAHVANTTELPSLQDCVRSVRTHHPHAAVYLVDDSSELSYAADIAAATSPNVSCRFDQPAWAFGAIGAALRFARYHNATHLAFFKQHMRLLRPLPLETLPCSFTSFQTAAATHTTTRVHKTSTARVNKTSTAHVNKMSSTAVVKVDKEWRRRVARIFLTDWVTHQASGFVAPKTALRAGHVFAHGFVSDQLGMQRLSRSRLFQRVRVCHGWQDGETERLLGAIAHELLDSPPLRCSLDGCASQDTAVLRDDLGQIACINATYAVSQRLQASNLHAETQRQGRVPPSLDAATADASSATAQRFVSPPSHIAADAFVALLPNGVPLYGRAAEQRLAEQKIQPTNVLIYVHGFRQVEEFELHAQMLDQRDNGDSWLVQGAAVLMVINNAARSTTELLDLLRKYQQASRWLLHSPVNFGYNCGEFFSLVLSQRVWSRYPWVLYSHPDDYVTPKAFAHIASLLKPDIGMLAENFPRPRFMSKDLRFLSMDYFVFRPSALMNANGSAWMYAANTCVRSYKAMVLHERAERNETSSGKVKTQQLYPERLLFMVASSQEYNISLHPLGAIKFTFAKTPQDPTSLWSGGVWHTHNKTKVRALLEAGELK